MNIKHLSILCFFALFPGDPRPLPIRRLRERYGPPTMFMVGRQWMGNAIYRNGSSLPARLHSDSTIGSWHAL